MSSAVWDYDASVESLHDPGSAADFFTLTARYALPALCAEMARLAYCPDLDRVSDALRRAGYRDPVWFRGKGTDAFLTQSDDMAVLAFRGTRGPNFRQLLDPGRLQRLFAGSGFDWQKTLRRSLAGALPAMQNGFERLLKDSEDIFTDLDFLPQRWPEGGVVHRGFAQALGRVWDDIAPHLERLDLPVLYTGHSLGAALATLAASRRPPETLYTFGAPTVGNNGFAATLDGVVVYRYVNCCDIVCRLPPALYDPIGRLRYIASDGRLAEAEENEAVKRTARLEHFRRTAGQWDKVWVRDLVDHAPVNYVRALLANQ